MKLTLTPGDMSEADLAPLRAHGFDDEQITVAAQVISYFNYINRIADGLGVDDEVGWPMTKEQWLARRGQWSAEESKT